MTNLMEAAATFGDKASEVGSKAEELVRAAGKTLKDARSDTVDGLHAAASSVRISGHQGSEAIDNLANRTADKLDATASYVEDPLAGLRRVIRRHPARSLVVAAIIGLFAGCAITHSLAKKA